jgi:demethylmenaquinone methyltransferase/2-methoxy-6-polyprenyl-1,4-benzoquinol methylase
VSALPPAESKADVVERMFDRLAPRYDRVNRLLTFGMDQRWRRTLLEMGRVGRGDMVLDLACGTGDLAALASRRGARVAGLDFAAAMVARAAGRHACPWLVRGDALALPFADATFDAVVSGFAIRNLTNLPVVFEEAARVLKPGGRFAILEIDSPAQPWLRAGHRIYFDGVVPRLGGLLSGDDEAYRYLSASAAYLPPKREFARLFREAGFREVRKRRLMGGAIQALAGIRR